MNNNIKNSSDDFHPISFDSKDFEDFIEKTIKRFKEIQLKEMTTYAGLLTWYKKRSGLTEAEAVKFLYEKIKKHCTVSEIVSLKDYVENWRKSEDDPENGTYIDETTKQFKNWFVVSQKNAKPDKLEDYPKLRRTALALLRTLDFNQISEFASNEGGNPKVVGFLEKFQPLFDPI